MVSFNLPLVRLSHRVLLFLLNFPCMTEGDVNWSKFMQIVRGCIIEGGVMSSEYSTASKLSLSS